MTKFYFIPNSVIYYMNLHLPRTLKGLQYRLRNDVIVYAIRCQINNKVYVGSTFTPGRRLHQHLVTGEKSNLLLQADIQKYGIDHFTLYIMEIVEFKPMIFTQRTKYLREREQYHMNKFSQKQLYNSVRSSAK
jgi:group I intron endonuclease